MFTSTVAGPTCFSIMGSDRHPSQNVPIVIVGTKSDLTDERQVTYDAMKELNELWGQSIPFLSFPRDGDLI